MIPCSIEPPDKFTQGFKLYIGRLNAKITVVGEFL
jgi:hypothetical protein